MRPEPSTDRTERRAALATRLGVRLPDLQPARRPVDHVELLRVAGLDLKHDEVDHHVTLSPRSPYVEGRGHLDVLLGRVYWGEGDKVDLITPIGTGNTGDPNPKVDVWLDGLALDKRYAVIFRVSGSGAADGRFRVSHSEGPAIETDMQPFDPSDRQHVLVLLDSERDLDMALLRIEALDADSWMFHDVTVSEFPG